ncbi:MAG TPA: FxSxx-COOH cyclophane-containing RiPP peptide [Gemmatimonadales bacterium]|jgi:hypothetical protein
MDMDEEEDDLESELVDVTGIDLDALADVQDSVMGAALLRIYREMTEDVEPFSGFQQSI